MSSKNTHKPEEDFEQNIQITKENINNMDQNYFNQKAAETRKYIDVLLDHVSECEEYYDLLEFLIYHKERYIDKEFPPKEISLIKGVNSDQFSYFSKQIWARPKEIFQSPEIFCNKISAIDIRQGELANDYFISAISAQAEKPYLIRNLIVFPNLNKFDNDTDWMSYGAFNVRICLIGVWKDIIIDDNFPCFKDKFPGFTSGANNQLWTMILEKTWAKVHCSYARIENGQTSEVLHDFTGAPVETVLTEEENFWDNIIDGYNNNWVMTAKCGGRSVNPNQFRNELKKLGLKNYRSYTVQSAFSVYNTETGVCHFLIRLRNPWVDSTWTGDWNFQSDLWTNLIKRELKKQVSLFSILKVNSNKIQTSMKTKKGFFT